MNFEYLGSRNPDSWVQIGSIWQSASDIYVRLRDAKGFRYTWHILPGFRCDMGSIPKCFQWFVPSYDPKNPILDVAFAVHDAAYGSELVSKELADDMLRDTLIAAGISRFRANTVHWAVDKFAKSHYGVKNDTLDNKGFVDLRVYLE